jgi:predicted PurR-regulated permease PerM
MDLTKFGGLPTHPLLVHIPVVLLVVRKRWVERYGVLVLVLGFAAAAGTAIASQAGEGLRPLVNDSPTLRNHVNLAGQTKLFVGAFFLVLAAWIVADWLGRHRPNLLAGPRRLVTKLGPVVPVLCLVLGVLATIWVFRTGHEGARATWMQRQLKG